MNNNTNCGVKVPARLSAMLIACITTLAALSGCLQQSSLQSKTSYPTAALSDEKMENYLPEQIQNTMVGKQLHDGLVALSEGDRKDASKKFQSALKLQPENSYLHLLVGLLYHLETIRGNSNQYELAELGYRYALHFDPGNWLAARQLGRFYYERRRYVTAQEYFARALLLEPDLADMYLELAAASYYSGDLRTAYGAAREAVKRDPINVQIVRNAPVIFAAAGDATGARTWLSRYQGMSHDTSIPKQTQINNAIVRWQELYDQKAGLDSPGSGKDRVFLANYADGPTEENEPDDESVTDDEEVDGGVPQAEKMALVELVIIRMDEQMSTSKGSNLLRLLNLSYSQSWEKQNSTSVTSSSSSTNDSKQESGIVQESSYTSSDGYSSTSSDGYSSTSSDAYSSTDSATTDSSTDSSADSTTTDSKTASTTDSKTASETDSKTASATDSKTDLNTGVSRTVSSSLSEAVGASLVSGVKSTLTSTILRSISIPTVIYNLNIINSSNNQGDILARPSLLVENGKTSDFSLVDEQRFAVRGQESGSLEQIDAGIKVSVEAEYLEKGVFRLGISGEASVFQPTSSVVGTFQEAVRIGKAQVNTSAVIRFGQTLVISGFNQRSHSSSHSGVPFLKDLPGVQYLFSEKTVIDRQTSIMMLLTLKDPCYTTATGVPLRPSGAETRTFDDPEPLNLEYLIRSRPQLFQENSGLDIVMDHLQNSSDFYRKFRTGDIRVDHWDTSPNFENLLRQSLGFLYF